ncbi:CrcB protein [Cryobacterium psychrotolerans]|uniref:Fluoride-specific ion channel FluC n=1 Tax=Cryobacterium psychrotolerans TaxID=386301 RepID=A0A1G8YN89_9MICO|nr:MULTISPECIES: CrcB family protein [Cryobacterium]TFD48192.1 CrcB family protein [Cryobacterium sp. TMT1-2-1]TFD85341.1 CrcB family protein [Cryobacterium psychrotolerans]SDK03585.1 CrcB protein [Cryobacterium psychrotolerans]
MPLALAAFLGGVLGTGLRLATDLVFPHADAGFPAGTLGVNVLGALMLGWLVGGLWTRPGIPRWLKVALGPGLLGSFTTFSAVTVSLVEQSSAGLWGLAGLYLLATLALGFGAAAFGLWAGSRLAHRPIPVEIPDDGSTL